MKACKHSKTTLKTFFVDQSKTFSVLSNMAAVAASPEVPSVDASSFEHQFKDLTSLITFFEQCSQDTQQFINGMKQILSESIKTDLITDTERERLLSYSAKKSTLLVVGQTNSGKSSFVNELLGGSFMPTSEVPCTSRIVRLKYSEENYFQVLNESRHSEAIKTTFSKKKLPKEAIELDESKRGDPSWINAVVEVGLNNPLLQSGHLEVIDAPGMSENESLDKIVHECIHGVLQVIIYVIDGNSSLRLQERGFLLNLKEKVGNFPIFYVCNKVDRDQTAREFDRDSDAEDDEESEPRSEEEKVNLVYQALVNCQMVPEDMPWNECPFFHGLSSKEVRNARLKKVTNQFTGQFDILKSKLLKFAAIGVNAHLKSATELLCQIQDRAFDLFLTCDFQIPVQSELFDYLESKEQEYVQRMRGYVRDNRPKFAKMISKAISNKRMKIETDACQIQFESIKIGDVVGRNEVVEQCRRQIKDLVLYKAMAISMEKVRDTIAIIASNLRTSLEEAFGEVAKQDDRLANLVKRQLEYSFLQNFQEANVCQHFDYALMKFGVKMMDEAKKVVSDVWSAFRGKGTVLNQDWKRNVAKDVLDSVDTDAIADRICVNILADLENGHQLFQINLRFMKGICETAAKQTDDQQKFAAAKAPYFSRLMSNAAALYQTLALKVPSRAVLGARLGRKGYRGDVFEIETGGKQLVAKQLTCDDTKKDELWLGITRTARRMQDDLSTILKPTSLQLDQRNTIAVLLPRMSIDLFDRLERACDVPVLISDGLRIVRQMADAIRNCWNRGLYHVDLRITNVLLDRNNNARLNVSKPRDDSIPYPDEKAPFHVPDSNPGVRKFEPGAENTLKTHCVYSLAVLLWLLVEQKFCRPDYAMTTDVNRVYEAIAKKKDSKYISKRMAPSGEISGTRKQALQIVVSTLNAQKQEGLLLEWLDNFQVQVTELLSSCETMCETSV